MIRKVSLNDVASFKSLSSLETDKKINLIYGLNGSGKSTFSNFLYNPSDSKYSKCAIDGDQNEDILVYNQNFINDYFYEEESLKGIFTLSKENKDAKEKIANANKEIQKLTQQGQAKQEELGKLNTNITGKLDRAQNKIWEIKGDYTGGDRVLEFCLEGLKGNKSKLFDHIVGIDKPDPKSIKDIEKIKEEVQALSGENAVKYDLLRTVNWNHDKNEKDPIFTKEIVGNENSSVAQLITELGNSDWVKEGIKYLPEKVEDPEECPFCQEQTITQKVIQNIKEYFSEAYQSDVAKLDEILESYLQAYSQIPQKLEYTSHHIFSKNKEEVENKYNALDNLIKQNISLIKEKINTPSKSISLVDTTIALQELNEFIGEVNKKITSHNTKIDNKTAAMRVLKSDFWKTMRNKYNQTIESYIADHRKYIQDKKIIDAAITELKEKVVQQQAIIIEQQKNTVNVDEAIENINHGLIDLGIEEFSIKKHSDSLYKVVRGSSDSLIFQTLSEGEKMIISFLYFIELCRGKKDAESNANKKIIVIDDPISSLSHIYVFNVGRLIMNEFILGEYEQVYILTHSLYFFYELADTNHNRRKEHQRLFRIVKNSVGSTFHDMKYEEIQNDYQSYWRVIKDKDQPPALVANCMRNIVEYFFNFIEKRDLSNVIQKPELQDNKYKAFFRYIHRESHSLGQNIFDIKEFNYDDFKEALRLLFVTTGYEEHYKRMMR